MSKATFQPPVIEYDELTEHDMTHEEFELYLEMYRVTEGLIEANMDSEGEAA